MRITYPAQSISVKALQSIFPPTLVSQKIPPSDSKMDPELTALVYQGKILGIQDKDFSPTKRKPAGVVDAEICEIQKTNLLRTRKSQTFSADAFPRKNQDKAEEDRQVCFHRLAISP